MSRESDPTRTRMAEALEHARNAMALAPTDGVKHNTLAPAEYRAGHLAESIAAAERSVQLLKDVDSSNWSFLAIAHGRRGETDRARGVFDRAVAWTRQKDPPNAELLPFWREAAAVPGRPGPDAFDPPTRPDLPAAVLAP